MMTFGSLYSGGGLADVGLRAAGLEHRFGVELDAQRVAVAHANGLDVRHADVLHVLPTELPRVDWLHASPPCTRFTQANPDAAKGGGRATALDLKLALAVADYALIHRPAWISVENVLGWRDTTPEVELRAALLGLGYKVKRVHLNAANFGTAQHRNRYFLLAGRDKAPREPHPTHARTPELFLRSWVGWDEACPDWRELPVRPLTARMEALLTYAEGKDLLVTKNHRAKAIEGAGELGSDPLLCDTRYALKPKLVQGGTCNPLDNGQGVRLPIYRTQGEPSPAFTQRSVMQVVVTKEGARTLSPSHLVALSGLPAEWVAPDNLTILRSVLGLGVCPPVMQALVEAQR